jgi:hypothetical protein
MCSACLFPKTRTMMMMNKPDLTIRLSTHRSTSRWAFEIKGPHYIARLGAGRCTSATAHTLLAIALTAALQQVSPYIVKRMTGSERAKLSVQVETQCPTFKEVCEQVEGAGLRKSRAAHEIFRRLRTELRRHNCTFVKASDEDLKRAALFCKRMYAPTSVDEFALPASFLS